MNAALRLALVLALTWACAPSVRVPTGAHLTKTAGDLQIGLIGQRLPIGPSVLVTGEDGKPVAGVPVGCLVTIGGGTSGLRSSESGADGIANCGAWQLGGLGLNQLQVYANDVDPVVFSAAALHAPSTFDLSIETPDTTFDGNGLQVVVKITDDHRVSEVDATFGGQAQVLTGSTNGRDSTFTGTIDDGQFQVGAIDALIVRATDDHFGVAEAALLLTFNPPPDLVVTNPPSTLTFSRPMLQLSATANADTDVTLTASVHGTVLAQGTNILLQTVDLSAFDNQIDEILITATDATGASTAVAHPVWVSSNPKLQPAANVDGVAIDFDGQRALHAADGGLMIADLGKGTDVTVSSELSPAALSPLGAVACEEQPFTQGKVTVQGLLSLVPRDCLLFDVEGPFVFYTDFNNLPFLADLDRNVVMPASPSFLLGGFSLAPTGDAVFNDTSGNIVHVSPDGGAQPLPIDHSDGGYGQSASTDGHLIAYRLCFNSGCPSIGVWDGVQETRITPPVEPNAVWVNNGWLVWTNQANELWESRWPAAGQKLGEGLTPIALLPSGTVVAISADTVWRVAPGGAPEPILLFPLDQPFPKVVQRNGHAWFLLEGLAVEVLP